MSKHKLSIHIFRRDLRLKDNTSLIEAVHDSNEVIPCFIFDERQLHDNPYKSENALQFMVSSVTELREELKKNGGKLFVFKGIAHEIVDQLIKTVGIEAVYVNKDYTPFSKTRDRHLELVCNKHKVDFYSFDDTLLNPPGTVLKDNGAPYTIFTPFLKKSKQIPVKSASENSFRNCYTKNISGDVSNDLFEIIGSSKNSSVFLNGGRNEAIELVERLYELENYETTRNLPSVEGTSKLSAHLKFGTVSAREVYWTIAGFYGINHPLLSELYWRDFFTHIAWHFPHVFGNSFHKKFDKIEWENDETKFKAWCNGNTGFPIVDAGMRQLNTTGWMHNRVRMVTASFLVKDLHIDWRWGEKYFAQKLIDYDPAVNNGNWQWAASTGCDAQPWFRIFNPWLQQKKYDPECFYIKNWIPELKDFQSSTIHNWHQKHVEKSGYPSPIVDHTIMSKTTKELYLQSR